MLVLTQILCNNYPGVEYHWKLIWKAVHSQRIIILYMQSFIADLFRATRLPNEQLNSAHSCACKIRIKPSKNIISSTLIPKTVYFKFLTAFLRLKYFFFSSTTFFFFFAIPYFQRFECRPNDLLSVETANYSTAKVLIPCFHHPQKKNSLGMI